MDIREHTSLAAIVRAASYYCRRYRLRDYELNSASPHMVQEVAKHMVSAFEAKMDDLGPGTASTANTKISSDHGGASQPTGCRRSSDIEIR